MINDMTLNRFVYHTIPQISQMLRYREFTNINNALTAALAEKKALRIYPKNQLSSQNFKSKPQLQNRNYHHNNNNNFRSKPINFNQVTKNIPTKQCTYCKKFGHVIEECRKREFNDSRKNQSQPPYSYPTGSTPSNQGHTSKNVHFQQQNFPISSLNSDPPNPVEQITEQIQEFIM